MGRGVGSVHSRLIQTDREEVAQTEPSATTSSPAVRLCGVSKRFGSAIALDAVTLEIPVGKLVTLLGPSGCGKTTLLRIIAGFESPTSGRVEIDGLDVGRLPPERRPVNLVFQRWALFPHMNVLENVMFGLQAVRTPRRDAKERAREALAMCRMKGFDDRRVTELSGGQAQRVAVARALVNRPKVLLLDEPLSALDLKLRRHMQVELRRLQHELEMTFVYVTHDQDEALAMSDSIVLMNDGCVVQQATPRELYERPGSLFAATFIGEPNVLPCTVLEVNTSGAIVDLGGVITTARVPRTVVEGRASLCLRPERVRLGETPATARGIVQDVIFVGSSARYWLTVGDVTFVAETPIAEDQRLLEIGEETTISWDPDAAVVFAD